MNLSIKTKRKLVNGIFNEFVDFAECGSCIPQGYLLGCHPSQQSTGFFTFFWLGDPNLNLHLALGRGTTQGIYQSPMTWNC